MEIINNQPYLASDRGSAPQSSGFTSTNSDFQTFLKMLTAQITNQDPLNPMEGSDFAVQLATFAGVEQQTQTNKLLQSMLDTGTSEHITKLSHLIGRHVLTSGPVHYSGDAIEVQLPTHEDTGEYFLVVSDIYGREIERHRVSAGESVFSWPVSDAQGHMGAATGNYTFHLESSLSEGEVIYGAAGAYVSVIGAETSRDGARLVLTGDIKVDPDEVLAIR